MRFAFRDIRLITSIVLVAVILLAASVPTGAQPYAVPLTWVRQITQEMPEGRQFANAGPPDSMLETGSHGARTDAGTLPTLSFIRA